MADTTTTERPAGMGGVIYDANKGLDAIAERDTAPMTTTTKTIRQLQEEALAHEWVQPSRRPPMRYDNETMPSKVYHLLCNRDVIFTQKMIANRLGCNVSTLKEWKAVNPDMGAAIAQGLAEQEGWLATQMANGMKYSASMYAVLKNLHDWSDKIESRTTLDLTEAIRKQASGAKRVDWDGAHPDPLHLAAGQPRGHVDTPPMPNIPAPSSSSGQ